MPASDCLQPPLNKAEREICKGYGGWTHFMHSYGLKPWDHDDAEEGKAIIAALARPEEAEDEPADKTSNANSGTGRG